MRLFVAAEISDEIRHECKKMIDSLNESGADLKTVRPENLHVTMKFLGDVREDYVKRVSDTLKQFSGDFQPLRAGFSVMGYFGGTRFPRVIWVGISEGREIISEMAGDLNKRLSWIRKDDRKPRPHLTLARVRTTRNTEKLLDTIRLLRDVKLGELNVNEIVLKQSILKPDGPVYKDIEVFRLGKKES